jgi:hypothetical protein
VSDDPLFVERGDDDRYKVERASAERASKKFDTQKEAIEWAKGATLMAPCMSSGFGTKNGSPDKWRKA